MQKKKRKRESEVWDRVIDLVGRPPESTRFLHIFDAGADNIEVFCHLQIQRCGWVVRAAQKCRVVLDAKDRRTPLENLVQQQPLAGTYELWLRARERQPARTATIEVRFAPMCVPLQLKFVARTDPDRPAAQVVPPAWIRMLKALCKGRHQIKNRWRILSITGHAGRLPRPQRRRSTRLAHHLARLG